jgi:crotonobetainyl-CoA:carnitine CoA-transferase CaiB-like acyl-CoA transferase
MSAPNPLAGFKVVSFCHWLQGAAATQYLSDLGADVIKIEPMTGAHERHWSGGQSFVKGVSTFFLAANRNKRSLAVDLKNPEGRQLVLDLIAKADAVVENFRPGVMDRLGLGFESLKEIKPSIIFASGTGYGPTGPLKDKPGQDLLAQARSGLIAATGDRFENPKAVGGALVDQHAGALLALGLLAAYVRLLTTGEGTRVESNLYNAALDLQAEPLTAYLNGGHTRERYRRDSHLATWFHEAPYGVYRLKDGFVAVPLNDPSNLAEALGSEQLQALREIDRYERRNEYASALADALAGLTMAQVSERFDQYQIWYAPVLDYDDVAVDPQTEANQIFLAADLDGVPVTLVNHPVRYDGAAPELRHLAIQPGADAIRILRALGKSDSEIQDLGNHNVVALPPATPNSEPTRVHV